MQLFSVMMQLWGTTLDSLFYSSFEAQYLLTSALARLSEAVAVDILLLSLFLVGFLICRASRVRNIICGSVWRPGKYCDEGTKLSMATAVTSQKDISGHLDFCQTGPRLRCSKLCAQVAGQPPELPQACSSAVLKNIPSRYTPSSLLVALHECGYLGKIDFLYVPIDFKKADRNLGFAIMNFSSAKVCSEFAAEFHLANASDKWPDARSQRCLEVSPAVLQGSEENIRHLQKSPVLPWLTQHPAWLPQVLDERGLATPLKATRGSSSLSTRGSNKDGRLRCKRATS